MTKISSFSGSKKKVRINPEKPNLDKRLISNNT